MNEVIHECFAVTTPGLEAICATELARLGIVTNEIKGGVGFSGGVRELYLANLWLRSANRVLVRLGTVTARDFPTLYQRLVRLPWGRFIKPGTSCDVRAVSHRSRLSHTGRITEVCQQAISKALGRETMSNEGVQRVLLRLYDNHAEVSVDSSGDHLHRRGYRQARSAAPLRENLAAAALLACGYDGSMPLVDMMTGSGTFVIEAGLIAGNRAPGVDREFSFMLWPKYRAQLWQQLVQEARKGESSKEGAPIRGIDNNPKAIAAAQINLCRAGLAGNIGIDSGRLQELVPVDNTGLLIGNPPYGARLGRHAGLPQFYRDVESLCKEAFAGWRCALVCPEAVVKQMTGLRFHPLLSFSHGGIKVSLYVKEPGLSP